MADTLKFTDFTTELSTERQEQLEALQSPAKLVQERYEAFTQAMETATADIKELEVTNEDLQGQLAEVEGRIAVEVDLTKAKELRGKKLDLQEELELYENVKRAKHEARTAELLDKAVAFFETESPYYTVLRAFAKAVEVTANSLTITQDLEAVNEAEGFYTRKHNIVGLALQEFGIYPKHTKYVKLKGKQYGLSKGLGSVNEYLVRLARFYRIEWR